MTISSSASLDSILDEIRRHDHATAGFTIASTGALAAGLGQACVGISHGDTSRLAAVALGLRDLGDEDATALSRMIALRDEGQAEEGYAILIAVPMKMADLACEAAEELQRFRPRVEDHVRDDMEFALHLLAASARASLMLIESNLRQWRMPALHAKYGPETERLAQRIAALSPVERIAWRPTPSISRPN